LRRLCRSEDGVTLTELAVALFISAIVVAGATVWAVATLNQDRANQDATATIDELRYAKSQLMRELRFASEVYPPSPGDDYIEFWLDDGDDVLTAGIGEVIRYEIMSDGTFVRTTDDASAPSKLIATALQPADSSFTVTGKSVDILLTVDFDPTDSYQARSLETTITARNK
jgi:prepilin-type N-terminal cleavage/methylation domain-containing protein